MEPKEPENNTDQDWEFFAKKDPYWAVLTRDQFKRDSLNDEARAEFFLSGEKYIDWVFSMLRRHIDAGINPGKGLDFGCGVGRLLVPIARRCQAAVGTDISKEMLREAEKVCQAQNLKNVSLVKSDDNCSALTTGFDFINSFIVLQHIPCDRGIGLFRRLLDLLTEGGAGAIHLTYSRSSFPVNAEGSDYESLIKGAGRGGRHHLAGIKCAVKNQLQRSFQFLQAPPVKPAMPVMQMNSYLLNPIFQMLHEAGVRETHLAFSDHTGALGMVLFFKKTGGLYPYPSLRE